jgi:carboxyl-terminal processing protease
VGEKTFGKGIIQNLQQISRGGVAVTVAKYETPNHTNINKVNCCELFVLELKLRAF